jgi:hypothetical protein
MHCVSCGLDRKFERVAVGRGERPVFGSVCRDCEKRHLGPLVTDGDVEAAGCCLCGGEGAYAVPEWDAIGVSEDDGALEFLEYTIDESTPHLCESHFDEMANETAAEASDAITSVRSAAADD